MDQELAFNHAGKAKYHGKKVRREVAEVNVTLAGVHKKRINGKQKDFTGQAIPLRAVFVRLVDDEGYILAEWMLLTNVPLDQADTATIGQWYYFRWRIESFLSFLRAPATN